MEEVDQLGAELGYAWVKKRLYAWKVGDEGQNGQYQVSRRGDDVQYTVRLPPAVTSCPA